MTRIKIIENMVGIVCLTGLFCYMYWLDNPIFVVFAFVGVVIISIFYLFKFGYEAVGLIVLIIYIGAIAILFLFCVSTFVVLRGSYLKIGQIVNRFNTLSIVGSLVIGSMCLNWGISSLLQLMFIYNNGIHLLLISGGGYSNNINFVYATLNWFSVMGESMYDTIEWGGMVSVFGVFLLFILFIIYGLTAGIKKDESDLYLIV